MIFYSVQEICLIIATAIIIDWVIGDPKWPTHPVIFIGRWIKKAEQWLYPAYKPSSNAKLSNPSDESNPSNNQQRSNESRANRGLIYRGSLLTTSTLLISTGIMLALMIVSSWIHPWLGYAVNTWFISTTIAVKGLKDAAMLVYHPLIQGNMADARTYIGYIVSRDQEVMGEPEITRAAVETVSENIVDAFISPIFWAMIGAAPLAMCYRAANTLDSMVGYRNEKYEYFGKCSAVIDDILNYIPARITGVCIAIVCYIVPRCDGRRAVRSMLAFASHHPSPNSGIPESAVAGALGIQLGGRNRYFGVWQERAIMGWETEQLRAVHIKKCIVILYGVSILVWVGVMLAWLMLSAIK